MGSVGRRKFLIASGALFAAPFAAAQQSNTKTVQIGILVGGSVASRGYLEQPLLERLKDSGYVEGRNLIIVRRYADGHGRRMVGFARELAEMNLDAVITTCTASTRLAKRASDSMPIVMAAVADPVGQRLIASLAKPGGNITGLSSQSEGILSKMMGFFAEVLPESVTIAVFAEKRSEVHPLMWQQLAPIAQALGLKLVKIDVAGPEDVPAAFDRAVGEHAKAIFVLPDEAMFLTQRRLIVELAAKHRMPAFYGLREFVEVGGLMSYGEDIRTAYGNAAGYVDNLARGAKPGDLPVQQPTKFELAVNLTAAKALDITFPQSILIGADHVIQ